MGLTPYEEIYHLAYEHNKARLAQLSVLEPDWRPRETIPEDYFAI